MTPTLVLTRPDAQSRALAAEFGAGVRVVVSPILEIQGTEAQMDLAGYAGVILTSANAVRFGPELAGVRADCVGKVSAAAAQGVGAVIGAVAENADALVGLIEGPGPLLHLRGEHARGAVAERLSSAGIETHEAVVYRQVARGLTDEARAAIEGDAPVVLPLYSPRSARLVGAGVSRLGPGLRVIAMSQAVGEAWARATGGAAEVCVTPSGAEMSRRIRAALRG